MPQQVHFTRLASPSAGASQPVDSNDIVTI